MMDLRVVFIVPALMFAHQAGAEAFHIEIQRATVSADPIELDDLLFSGLPAFNDDALAVAFGGSVAIGQLPFTADIFLTRSSTSTVGPIFKPDLPPMFPPVGTVYDLTVRARGMRISVNPVYPVSERMDFDWKGGVQFVDRRIDDSTGSEMDRQRDFGPFAGVGVTWRLTPRSGIRAGYDYGGDYRAFSLGWRYDM